jgi:hypothetical protein
MQVTIEPKHATNQHCSAKAQKNIGPSQHL